MSVLVVRNNRLIKTLVELQVTTSRDIAELIASYLPSRSEVIKNLSIIGPTFGYFYKLISGGLDPNKDQTRSMIGLTIMKEMSSLQIQDSWILDEQDVYDKLLQRLNTIYSPRFAITTKSLKEMRLRAAERFPLAWALREKLDRKFTTMCIINEYDITEFMFETDIQFKQDFKNETKFKSFAGKVYGYLKSRKKGSLPSFQEWLSRNIAEIKEETIDPSIFKSVLELKIRSYGEFTYDEYP
jgi:hypothetical protein